MRSLAHSQQWRTNGPIFDAIVKKNLEAYNAGDADAAAAMYDEFGVVVDQTNHTTCAGSGQIKLMLAEFIKMGKFEFKMPKKEIYAVGGDRFYVDTLFETTFESGVVMKGSSQQLYHKRGDQWKCMFESFEMQ